MDVACHSGVLHWTSLSKWESVVLECLILTPYGLLLICAGLPAVRRLQGRGFLVAFHSSICMFDELHFGDVVPIFCVRYFDHCSSLVEILALFSFVFCLFLVNIEILFAHFMFAWQAEAFSEFSWK